MRICSISLSCAPLVYNPPDIWIIQRIEKSQSCGTEHLKEGINETTSHLAWLPGQSILFLEEVHDTCMTILMYVDGLKIITK